MSRSLARIIRAATTTPSFNSVAENLVAISESPCQAELKLNVKQCNVWGTIHGGFSAMLVDLISTCHLELEGHPRSVSVELNTMYCGQAKLNDVILLESTIIKAGKLMAFCTVQITNKETNKPIAFGKHIKCFVNEGKKSET